MKRMKAANIVFDDAPLDQAIEGIVNGIYFNQGEVCCAGSRLLVQESVADLVDFVVARVLEAAPHPNADKLQVLTVDAGVDERFGAAATPLAAASNQTANLQPEPGAGTNPAAPTPGAPANPPPTATT